MNRPIGIFDSGVGGLTVANAISMMMPNESFVYFGDQAHLPYGDKKESSIQRYSKQICQYLVEKHSCKAIVVACNTASSVAIHEIRSAIPNSVPVVDVIEPVVQSIAQRRPKKIGLIGTKRTVQSNVYQKKIKAIDKNIDVTSVVTRSLASLIEERIFEHPEAAKSIIKYYLMRTEFESLDGFILACTHYPLMKTYIDAFFDYQIPIYDSPLIVAHKLDEVLKKNKINATKHNIGTYRFFVSELSNEFKETAKVFFQHKLNIEEVILSHD